MLLREAALRYDSSCAAECCFAEQGARDRFLSKPAAPVHVFRVVL